MLKIEKVVLPSADQWECVIRGTRNPKNSWSMSDTVYGECDDFVLGEKDKKLMSTLSNAGPTHGKFKRMIVVYLDIIAPFYWWKEMDTYKVGTVADSCSTMHKISAKEFTIDDFSYEHIISDFDSNTYDSLGETVADIDGQICNMNAMDSMLLTIRLLNAYRDKFIETKDKKYWWQLIQLLPTSYNQRRTVLLNYEVLTNIYHTRKNHKLDEWHTFCDWIKTLPYAEEFIIGDNND